MVIPNSELTLAETVTLLSTFDAESGEQRPWRGNDGSPYAAASAASLLDLLFLGSISVTPPTGVPNLKAQVFPEAVEPAHPGLARGRAFIASQRKVRTAHWYLPTLERRVDSIATLIERGLVTNPPKMTQRVLTLEGILMSNRARQQFSGERGAALAALIKRGRLHRHVFPHDWEQNQERVLTMATAAPDATRQMLDPLGSHSAPSVG